MSKEKISVQELVDLMVIDRMITKKTAEEFIKVLLSTIEDALTNGEPVKVKGLGTFKSQWNEPRKSVDVNSGEEIVIDGYYRAVFVPENELRDIINEPFAHLEPVVLENADEKTKSVIENEVVEETEIAEEIIENMAPLEPLRIFEEQAEEIKGLLSEINSLSPKKPVDFNPEIKEDKQVVIVPELTEADQHLVGVIADLDDVLVEENVNSEDEIPAETPVNFVQEVNDFDIIRDLSLLLPASAVIAEEVKANENEILIQEETEKEAMLVEEDELEDEDVEEIQEDIEDIESDENDEEIEEVELEEELSPVMPIASITPEEVEIPDEEISNEEVTEINELAEDQTILEEDNAVDEKIEVEEKDFDKTTITTESNTLETDGTDEKKSRMRKILIYVLILIALAAIAWFVFNLRKYTDFKTNQKRVESIADSTAQALKVRIISDSLAKTNSAYAVSDSALISADSVKIGEPLLEAEPQSAPISTGNIFENLRTYNSFIATEKMVVGSQLTKFAKQYYGNPVFWVYIYEANKSKIADPNNVPAGIDVKIPKMDPRLIDAKNVDCINYAKKLQTKYLLSKS